MTNFAEMWQYGREVQARNPGKQSATSIEVWRQLLPDADVLAISYRCMQLSMFERWLRWMWMGGQPSEPAFKAAATMELKRMAIGVVYKGDEIMERFVEEVHKAAA